MNNEKNIGGLWLKTSKDGKTKFMSGNIEIANIKHNFVVFKNKHKNKENQPDYVILPQQKTDTQPAPTPDIAHEEIPF